MGIYDQEQPSSFFSGGKLGAGPETPLSRVLSWAMELAGVPQVEQAFGAARAAGEQDWSGAAANAGALGMALAPMALGIRGVKGPIRAYHGSPHDFDKFDASKIGTGEGAQAYGHGLYMAGSEDVARQYRDNLGVRQWLQGKEFNDDMTPHRPGMVAQYILNGVPEETTKMALRTLEPSAAESQIYGWLNQGRALHNEAQKHGHMYEVDIHADPSAFLQWDKPLREHGGQAKSGLQEFGVEVAPPQTEWRMVKNPFKAAGAPDIPDRYTLFTRANVKAPWEQTRSYLEKSKSGGWDAYGQGRYRGALMSDDLEGQGAQSWKQQAESMIPRTAGIGPDTTGGEAYRLLGRGQEQQTSEALLRSGIPGISYLDQGSRAAGAGTSNYVVFNPSIIEILRKYGIVGPVAGTAAAPFAIGGQNTP